MFANKLSDLDDFLAPSLECIKPLLPTTQKIDLQSESLITIGTVPKTRPDLIKSNADKIASVTL
jgi:hypothetical protein